MYLNAQTPSRAQPNSNNSGIVPTEVDNATGQTNFKKLTPKNEHNLPKKVAVSVVTYKAICVTILSFALSYADTSDCFLSSLPHPLIGLLYFYDLISLMRSYLATSRPVRYTSSVVIRSTMYDTHLRATHTTTSSIRGVQIPIYLVSDATDSL